MYNPIATERAYRDLVHRLSLPAAPRVRLLLIVAFLERLLPWLDSNRSYVLELDERLRTLVPHVEPEGTDPAEMELALQVLGKAGADKATIAILAGATACQYAYVGETENAAALLGAGLSSPLPVPSLPNPLQRLQTALGAGGTPAEALRPVLDRWIERLSGRADTAVVPVLERSLLGGVERELSALRAITVGMLGISGGNEDTVDLDAAVFGADQHNRARVARPLAAARSLLAETHPRATRVHISARVQLDRTDALHEGTSADLAIAALLYCAILRVAGLRNLCHINPDVAVTGTVEENGTVGPVAASSIEGKVRAAFFSHIRYLVVPASLASAAEEVLGRLSARYPFKSLTVLGVGHLRDLFFDRRITGIVRTSAVRHLIRRVWHVRRPLAAVLFLTLVLTIARLLYGPLDRTPAGFEFSGERLLITNSGGSRIGSVEVGERTVRWAVPASLRTDGLKPRFAALADLDRDGRKEVLFFHLPEPGEGGSTVVSAKRLDEAAALWSDTIRDRFDFPGNPVHSGEYEGRHILASDADGDGFPEVYVTAANMRSFPSVVIRLDGRTGRRLGRYLHIGHVADMEIEDMDGDGVKELLVCGVNNAFRASFVAVLDPRNMDGHSPLRGHYGVTGIPKAAERSYLLIPKSDVGRTVSGDSTLSIAVDLVVKPAEGGLQCIVYDINALRSGTQLRGWLETYLGCDMRVRGFHTGDDYDFAFTSLQAGSVIRDSSMSEFLQRYGETFRYWDGSGWGPDPVFRSVFP